MPNGRQVVITILQFGCHQEASEGYQLEPEVHDGMLLHEVIQQQYCKVSSCVRERKILADNGDEIDQTTPAIANCKK